MLSTGEVHKADIIVAADGTYFHCLRQADAE
jgi:hypothetical protein